MDKYDLVQELWNNFKRIHEIQLELKAYFQDRALKEANFSIGEVVCVFDENKQLGEGIVANIFHGLNYSWDAFTIKKYIENPEKYMKAMKDIRYNVKAIKKGGGISERNAFGRGSYCDENSENAQYYSHLKKKP